MRLLSPTSSTPQLEAGPLSWLGSTSELETETRFCQELVRREARNFYWGFLALPREQRLAIYALYSFARQVDDDVDLNGNGHNSEHFAHHRARLDRCYPALSEELPPGVAGSSTAGRQSATNLARGVEGDPVMSVLARVVKAYDIPRDELEALIEGVEMDLRVWRYETWDDLRPYCERVASSVGRMCVRIFGYDQEVALDRAVDLGLAMQLANILRDVREDLELGRVYLPQHDLRSFSVTEDGLRIGHPGDGWESLVQHHIERARQYFDSGLRVTESIPRRAAACVLTMAGMYRGILAEIERDPYLPLRHRAKLGKRAKLLVMARSWLQAV